MEENYSYPDLESPLKRTHAVQARSQVAAPKQEKKLLHRRSFWGVRSARPFGSSNAVTPRIRRIAAHIIGSTS